MSFRYCLFVIICGGFWMASGHPNRRLIITGSLAWISTDRNSPNIGGKIG